MEDPKEHWEKIYQSKKITEVSWYQEKPETSLEFIMGLNLQKSAKIIDVGGGDSYLVDYLLAEGFTDVTVLDISEVAINRVKKRLGKKAANVKWIIADVASNLPAEKYDLWHDRAALHFLTKENSIRAYLENLERAVNRKGFVVLGTFSESGPEMCSGISVKQYSQQEMTALLSANFYKIRCKNIDHMTPSRKVQNFTFCSFRKRN